jgi:uncharacterized protein YraI
MACGAPQAETQPATVRVTTPANGSTIYLGQPITLEGEYSGQAINQLRLRINGQTHEQIAVPQGSTTFQSQWTPQFVGQQVIFVEAYDTNNTLIARSDLHILKVEPQPQNAPIVAPTAQPTVAPVASVVEPSPTAIDTAQTPQATSGATSAPSSTSALTTAPTTTPTAAPTVVPTNASASTAATITVVVNDYVNLRSGPGTNYDLIGRINKSESAKVIGKSADGLWWQVSANGKTAWVLGQLVQASAAANGVAVVQAPPAPTLAPTTQPTLTPTAPAVAEVPATPTPAFDPNRPPCNPSNPWWGVKIHNDPGYTFCVPVAFQFVPNANPDPDVVVIKWEIYGDFSELELRMDPNGQDCGVGTTGFREKVKFKEDGYVINTRFLPKGGYKLGLWATMNDGRIQDWGELNFCGKG